MPESVCDSQWVDLELKIKDYLLLNFEGIVPLSLSLVLVVTNVMVA